jgi:VanZ family protein
MRATNVGRDQCMIPQNLARTLAWLMLAIIVVLSLVPPTARPTTAVAGWAVPHALEHAGIFLLDGLAFGFGYPGHERWLSIGVAAFSGGIELAQLMVPGRHARISDFIVDVLAAGIGICGRLFLTRIKEFTPSRPWLD